MGNPVRNLQKKKLAAHGGRITQPAKGGLHYSCNVRRQRLTKLSSKSNDKLGLPWQISNGVNFFSNSPIETKKSGEILGKEASKIKRKKEALVLGLVGDLGGGKTTFLQGFAMGLGIKEKILSPTFIIFKKFKIPKIKNKNFKNFYHIDCYRIQKPKEILDLGFKEIISNPQNIVTIEWADRIQKILPKDTLILKFKFVNQNKREIKVSPGFPFKEFLGVVKYTKEIKYKKRLRD